MAFGTALCVVLGLVGVIAQDTVYEKLTTTGDSAGIYADPCLQDAGGNTAGPVRACTATNALEDLTSGSTLLLPSDFATTGGIGDGLITIHGTNFPLSASPTAAELARTQLTLLQPRESINLAQGNLDACRVGNAQFDGTVSGGNRQYVRLAAQSGSSTTKLIFKIATSTATQAGWLDGDRAVPVGSRFERLPAGLCVAFDETAGVNAAATSTNYRYTGLKAKVVVNCEVSTANTAANCAEGAAALDRDSYTALSSVQMRHLKGKATCCKTTSGFGTGQCINDKQSTCCGSAEVRTVPTLNAPRAEKCCNANLGWVSGDAWTIGCPCRNANLQKDADCPAGEQCCLQSKFDTVQTVGTCFNANYRKCCDDGTVYDDGLNQCCPVDGVIARSQQCSCDDDADCNGNGKCCKQTQPARSFPTCNKYAVWPTTYRAMNAAQQAAHLDTVCEGSCIDPNYQLCCNGVQAFKEYERCCGLDAANAKYNIFTRTCMDGRTSQDKDNYNDFRKLTLKVSETEMMYLIRAFWIFVLPTLLLLGTVGALALVLVFANKASSRSYSFVEASMIFLACVCALCALPLFFSPSYKYGIVFVVMALFTVLCAAARIRLLNAVCLLIQLITLLYVFDPFHGNQVLNFSAYRTGSGSQHRDSAGLFHTVDLQYRDSDFCTEFYDYFTFDTNLQDTNRFDNPQVGTFGYCSRDYVFALLVFSAVAVLALLLLFVMTIVALLLRFRKPEDPHVELAIVPQ